MGFWSDVWAGVKKVSGESGEEMDWARTLKENGVALLQVKVRNFLRTATPEDRERKGDNLKGRSYMSSSDEMNRLFTQVLAVYRDESARWPG